MGSFSKSIPEKRVNNAAALFLSFENQFTLTNGARFEDKVLTVLDMRRDDTLFLVEDDGEGE